jgi:ParB/RepB/Spo0J family partition protein
MTVQLIDVKAIAPNPYQPRQVMDEATIAQLADSIREHGLLQPPHARAVNGRFELAFGHRRLAAWKIAKPGEPFPCEVVELDDRGMFDRAIAENDDREPLNPVERAKALKRYIDEFKLTQLEAGKRFRLTTQGAVSNVLRLLQLPEGIQRRVGDGTLTERLARGLLPVCRLNDREVIDIVERAAAKTGDDRGEFILREVDELLRREAVSLHAAPWPDDWPGDPIALKSPVDDIAALPRCKGCPFAIGHRNYLRCARPKCYELKLNTFATQEAARVAKKTGIPLAAGGEKITMVFPGRKNGLYEFFLQHQVQELTKNKAAKELLRIVPVPDTDNSYRRHQVFGSDVVGLATINQAAIDKLLESNDPANKTVSTRPLTPAQIQKVKESEQAQQEAHREERASALKAKHDVSWLVIHTAKMIGERIAISGGVLDLVTGTIHDNIGSEYDLIHKHLDSLYGQLHVATGEARHNLLRELLALKFVGDELPRYRAKYDFDQMRKDIETLTMAKNSRDELHSFNIKLPKGWDQPPVHKTSYNCWRCGVFASGVRITKRDQAEGWAMTMKGKDVADVCCPDCAADKSAAKKALVKKGKKR